MKIAVSTKNIELGIELNQWKRCRAERYVDSYIAVFGPLFFTRTNLPFCKKACSRLFDKLNDPNRPLRKLSDLYSRYG